MKGAKNMKDQKKNEINKKNNLGLDTDEQEMNGLYGMAETKEENAINKTNNQQKY